MHYMGFTFGTLTHWDKAAMIEELFEYYIEVVFPIAVLNLIGSFMMYVAFSWVFVGPMCEWFVGAYHRPDIDCENYTATVFINFFMLA